MENQDIRWIQRLSNFGKAMRQLKNAVDLANERELSELERQGLIHAFELTHELAWNVMKDYFFDQGNSEIRGSKDATREAFSTDLIENGEEWMNMIKSRNKTSHTYNLATAKQIAEAIIDNYIDLFEAFYQKMEEIRSGSQGGILNEA